MSGNDLTKEDLADPLLQYMLKEGIPLTREKYISLAYGTDGPGEWGAELEAELPPLFRNKE